MTQPAVSLPLSVHLWKGGVRPDEAKVILRGWAEELFPAAIHLVVFIGLYYAKYKTVQEEIKIYACQGTSHSH